MKTKYLIIFLIMSLLTSVLLVNNAIAYTSLNAELSKYEPYPTAPGEIVKVWIQIQNVGDESAKNVEVELVPQYPYTLYGDSAVKTIQLIGVKNEYVVDYTLKIDSDATPGNNKFKIKVTDRTNDVVTRTYDLFLFIQSRDATIAISNVEIIPSQVDPGSEAKISVTIENMASTTMTDLSLKLNLQTILGTTLIDLPFAPTDSSSEKKIYSLNPGSKHTFSYNVKVYPDAVSKVYKIPITLSYFDSLGNQKNKTDFIGLTVNSVPELSSIIDSTDLSTQKRSGTINLKIINRGLNDIKFLTATILENENYDILSESNTVYVGNLVSDDYQTLEFKISLRNSENNIKIPIKLQYRDSNNQVYDVVQNVDLNLVDNSKLKEANGGSTNYTIILLVVVVIVGLIVYFRRRANLKKNKKGQF